MSDTSLEQLCDRGQALLMAMQYLQAEAVLQQAADAALAARNFDLLSRLYMPLQECRRQRRQRCGEGIVRLDLISRGPNDPLDPQRIVADYPHGQLLVAGWESFEPAWRVRALQQQRGLYAETFLAAAYPGESSAAPVRIVVAPLYPANAQVPVGASAPRSGESLPRSGKSVGEYTHPTEMPEFSVWLEASELPVGAQPGTSRTYAWTMALWERLHQPFVSAGDAEPDLARKIALYQRAIEVDYACELAHQRLSAAATGLARR